MPTRFIKESCRSSKNLDKVTDFEERLFWRLLTTADDFGRFLADPELVRSACFPRRDRLPLQKLIDALVGLKRNHLIILYSVKDRQYGQFCTFEEHQGKPRSRKSKYPAPLDTSLHADASTCVRVLADVTGHPDTDTNTNTNLSSLKEEGSGEKPRGKRPISDADGPTEKHFALGQQLGVNVGPEWGKFKNYCLAHDKRYANFEAAFRNWIANAPNMKGGSHAVR